MEDVCKQAIYRPYLKRELCCYNFFFATSQHDFVLKKVLHVSAEPISHHEP